MLNHSALASSNKKQNLLKPICIVGSPNSGKTTLFNWLTGSKFQTVNYPGATVDFAYGQTLSVYGQPFQIIDTPGTYSLFAKSPEEEVTFNTLYHHPQFGQLETLIVVVDGTQLNRHLYLVKQLQDAQFQFVIALTMSDLLKKHSITLNIDRLSEILHAPIIPIDGRLGGGTKELVESVRNLPRKTNLEIKKLQSWDITKIEETGQWIEETLQLVLKPENHSNYENISSTTAKLDQFFLNRYFGFVLFLFIMGSLFTSIFWLSTPLMDGIDSLFSMLSQFVENSISTPFVARFLSDGVIAAFAAVFIFVPQIFILFLGIGLLEDTGYLARAATIADKPLSKLGLNGRAFVPLLSGFACAIPAMMATRTMGSKRERWITMFIIPLMSCSARLPVFALLLSFFFYAEPAWKPGLALAGIYFLSLFIGGIVSYIAHHYLPKNPFTFFMIELPLYRKPLFKSVFKHAFYRTKTYIKRAGPVIFAITVLIWGGTNLPLSENSSLQDSYLSQVGKTIEPVFSPMGLDWKAGVSLLTTFAAREVFVSSLAVFYNIEEKSDSPSLKKNLLQNMKQAKTSSGYPVFTTSTIIGLILFFIISLQCLTTVIVAYKEMNSLRFCLLQLFSFTITAYLISVITVQGLRALGIS